MNRLTAFQLGLRGLDKEALFGIGAAARSMANTAAAGAGYGYGKFSNWHKNRVAKHNNRTSIPDSNPTAYGGSINKPSTVTKTPMAPAPAATKPVPKPAYSGSVNSPSTVSVDTPSPAGVNAPVASKPVSAFDSALGDVSALSKSVGSTATESKDNRGWLTRMSDKVTRLRNPIKPAPAAPAPTPAPTPTTTVQQTAQSPATGVDAPDGLFSGLPAGQTPPQKYPPAPTKNYGQLSQYKQDLNAKRARKEEAFKKYLAGLVRERDARTAKSDRITTAANKSRDSYYTRYPSESPDWNKTDMLFGDTDTDPGTSAA